MHNLIAGGYKIAITWVPGHMRIEGNERANTLAKTAAILPPECITVPHTDWNSAIKSKTYEK